MIRTLLFYCLIFTLLSCNDDQEYAEFQDLNGVWKKTDTVKFRFLQPVDSVKYDLFFNIRVDRSYGFNNLYLISKIKFPHGKIVQDTLEYRMAKPNGELLGKGGTGVKESKLWYKQGVTFPEEGRYKVFLRQAMRKRGEVKALDSLEGVMDVGLIIEKQKKDDNR